MPSFRDFKRRIGSVKNTQQITRAMKLVAASKVRRAQERIENARPYCDHISDLVNSLALRIEEEPPPLLRDDRKDARAVLLVVTSDKGLCGAYNTNVNRMALQYLHKREEEGKETALIVVGRKGRDFLSRRGYRAAHEYAEVYGKINFGLAKEIADLLTAEFLEGRADEVHVLTTEFISIIRQSIRLGRLIPLAPPVPDAIDPKGDPVLTDYLYEPSPKKVLENILPRHISVQVYRALLDAEASEFGARMTAMDNATRNAEEMIAALTLRMNRVRQAHITKEIIEVVSGADALKG